MRVLDLLGIVVDRVHMLDMCGRMYMSMKVPTGKLDHAQKDWRCLFVSS